MTTASFGTSVSGASCSGEDVSTTTTLSKDDMSHPSVTGMPIFSVTILLTRSMPPGAMMVQSPNARDRAYAEPMASMSAFPWTRMTFLPLSSALTVSAYEPSMGWCRYNAYLECASRYKRSGREAAVGFGIRR